MSLGGGTGKGSGSTTPFGLFGKLSGPEMKALQGAFMPGVLGQTGNVWGDPDAINKAVGSQMTDQFGALAAARQGANDRATSNLASRGIQGPAAEAAMAKSNEPFDTELTRVATQAPMKAYQLQREALGEGADFLQKILGQSGSSATSSNKQKNMNLGI